MIKPSKNLRRSAAISLLSFALSAACVSCSTTTRRDPTQIPPSIQAIFDKPFYKDATWGLRVIDPDKNEVLLDYGGDHQFFIGSVRKVFSVGGLLNTIGPTHTYDTPIYRRGKVDAHGTLQGDLILVASGDLTMGGRTNPDGSIAYTALDHNEANTLGAAILTKPDPLAGYKSLAQQVKASGIRKVTGQIIIDDRLFKPFGFRDEFDVRPIFVNDDAVDLTILPTTPGKKTTVEHRPTSRALGVDNALMTSAPGTEMAVNLDPASPQCIGKPNCTAKIAGNIPQDLKESLTPGDPMVRMFRIVQPSNYARTVLIEQLQAAGVQVQAPPVAMNAADRLPNAFEYSDETRVALLKGMPYAEDAKLIMKVSYNIGAETSLVLFGLTKGVDTHAAALDIEKKDLAQNYGVAESEYHFVDGSGGGDTSATNKAVTTFLIDMSRSKAFPEFLAALPVMGVDGSLAMVSNFKSDPALAGALGKVKAKPGTYVTATSASDMVTKGQAFGGYIDTKTGRHLIYQLVVNNVPIKSIEDVLQIFQDEGTISAILWRDN
jgi:D-alanyl-D-alanine carboxypeptidase